MIRRFILPLFVSSALFAEPVTVKVQPGVTREIEGISKLERERYFALADAGSNLARSLKSPERVKQVFGALDANLGRSLGPLRTVANVRKGVSEDPARPGFVDAEAAKALLSKRLARQPKQELLKGLLGENFDVSAHGVDRDFPAFMGKFETEYSKKSHHPVPLPQNIDAAAEWSALAFRYGYDDTTRPKYYEPLNEPHWSFMKEQHLADWHLATHREVKKLNPEVQVGGPCQSVSYYYKDGYRVFGDFMGFIERTKGALDFYSFHVYDYYRSVQAGKNDTRISSGHPLEGVLDLVSNFAVNTLGDEVPLVVSEHGGYALAQGESSYDGEYLAREVDAKSSEPGGDGFSGEMRRRSIVQWLHVSSILTQTMSFIDHPHVLKKAVPFILGNTENWDPKYYASLFTPDSYQKGNELQESFLANYYRFFREVKGRRILADSPDPDLQIRAFANESTVYTIVNNLSGKAHEVRLKGLEEAKTHAVRRLFRDSEFIPTLTEQGGWGLSDLTVGAREAVLVVSVFDQSVEEKQRVNERVFYGQQIIQKISDERRAAEISLPVEKPGKITSAVLRIGFDRDPGSDYRLEVILNGKRLVVPMEDAAVRYEDTNGGYASTKMIPVSPEILTQGNSLRIAFPDGKPGTIGSAVIRARYVSGK